MIAEAKGSATPVAPKERPAHASGGIAHIASARKESQISEFGGWRIGDQCRTVYLGDGAKYPAVISVLKPETNSAVVTFAQYFNQQDTPLVFLERVEPSLDEQRADRGARGVSGEGPEKKRKTEIVIKPTDDEKTVERKKRLLKKQKRELKQAEKEKVQEKKLDHWRSFQNTHGARKGVTKTSIFKTTDEATVGVSKGVAKPVGAQGVRQKWTTSDKVSLPPK